MKKVNIIYLIVFYITIFAVLLSSCKKDYPKDTPEWIKEKIIDYKKHENINAFVPQSIKEYKNPDGDIIYLFYYSARSGGYRYIYYDLLGNEICETTDGGTCTVHGVDILDGCILNRTIWTKRFSDII